MHFIFLNSKVLLFLEALQTTEVSKAPPFPIKTSMENELFLESEIFPPPGTKKEHWPPGHMEYDQKEFSRSLGECLLPYKLPLQAPIPTTILLQEGYKTDFKVILN